MPSNPSSIADEAEAFVRQQAAELTRPGDDECLCCYVARQLEEFHCDGSHRHALRYRDAKAPRATGLLANLRRLGACCCDCELFLNAYQLRSGDGIATVEPLPPCQGVRRGSVQPCGNWTRIYRFR